MRSVALIELCRQAFVIMTRGVAPARLLDWLLPVTAERTDGNVCSASESQSQLSGLTFAY